MSPLLPSVLIVLAATAQTPSIETGPAPTQSVAPRNAVSLPLLSLFHAALAIEGEHFWAPRWSGAVSLGFRSAAGGDFRSVRLATGLEARRWLLRSPWRWAGPLLTAGPYLGLRADLSWTRLTEASGAPIGALTTFSQTLVGGFRVGLADKLEITPSAGFGLHEDLDPREGLLVPKGAFSGGVTVGVLF